MSCCAGSSAVGDNSVYPNVHRFFSNSCIVLAVAGHAAYISSSLFIWYLGKPLDHDPNFKGPMEGRSCTDVLCLLLFVVFIVVWAFLGLTAYNYGDPMRLLNPSDSLGHICGNVEKGKYNHTLKRFLYFFDMTQCAAYSSAFEGCPTPQVCVSKCPDYYTSYHLLNPKLSNSVAAKAVFEEEKRKLICIDESIHDEMQTFADVQRLVDEHKCTAYVVKSKPVLGRCIPAIILDTANDLLANEMDNTTKEEIEDARIANSTSLANQKGFVTLMLQAKSITEKVLEDLNNVWDELLVFLIAAAVVCFIWIAAMRWIAGIVIWTSILLLFAVLVSVTGASWLHYRNLSGTNGTGEDARLTLKVLDYANMTNVVFWNAVVFSVFLGIFVLALAFLFTRIRIAIKLIVESSKAVGHMLSTLAFPIVPFVMQLTVFAYWVTVATYLASFGVENCRRLGSNGTIDVNSTTAPNGTHCHCDFINSTQDPFCVYVNTTRDGNMVFMAQAYNLFGLFWAICFFDSFCQLTLAGAFASYYWAFRKPKDVPTLPLLQAFYRSIRYHIGSVAFGSLILAIIKFVRAILDYIQKKLKGAENAVAKSILSAINCCCGCFEAVVKFFSKNAYIMMAIHGESFCSSARESFMLLLRNMVRVFVVDHVTDFLLFVGKLLVTSAFGVLAYFYFSGELDLQLQDILGEIRLNYNWLPVVIVVIGTYCICCAFFDVYEMAVDTTFLCFCMDSEKNDGTPQKPYFMSHELMEILGDENKFSAGTRRNS